MLLETIEKPNDIKNIAKEDYRELAQEIRDFLIRSISVTGGHLGSNLGAVELTMALHLALNLPEDKIIWDVGHQSYTHKILTGRREGFLSLRQFHGMSGFPKRKESACDVFDTGHSSTSISAGLGMVKAREIEISEQYPYRQRLSGFEGRHLQCTAGNQAGRQHHQPYPQSQEQF